MNNDRDKDPDRFDAEVKVVCDLYAEAEELYQQGVHVVSTDEKTGIQALERKHPTKPLRPGQVERREFEYIRHGTQTGYNQHRRRGEPACPLCRRANTEATRNRQK